MIIFIYYFYSSFLHFRRQRGGTPVDPLTSLISSRSSRRSTRYKESYVEPDYSDDRPGPSTSSTSLRNTRASQQSSQGLFVAYRIHIYFWAEKCWSCRIDYFREHNIMHGLKHLFHQLGCLSAGAMVLVILLYTVYPLLHAYYPLVSNPTLQFIR